ncbi:hypothetical protein [Novosphingobium sp. SG720]|uniref:hypothetical protein n=1 Tax=Novosphingobium sp. SG720 TaxID=2586998 RepID=UPI0017D995E1|nr:hypothetical protein [Novosphingobium sp. SG720]NKJ40831.1 hypothetical protein [Novosphingobium sp. SG720]
MTIKKKLTALLREVIAEAEANPAFQERLAQVLGLDEKLLKAPIERKRHSKPTEHKRPSNRRTPAVLDPVQLARDGEPALREALAKLDIEQLRDVVADYGMDPGKLVMKWRDADRIADRIVEVARGRAQKGSAFMPTAEVAEVKTDESNPPSDAVKE